MTLAANRLSQVLNSLNTAIVIVDADNRIIYKNIAAETLISSIRSKLHDPTLSQLMMSVSSNSDNKPFVEFITRSRVHDEAYVYRQALLTVAGQQHFKVDCCITPLSDNEPGHVLLEIIVSNRFSKIEKSSDLYDQFYASQQIAKGLAHEINNPLGGIRGAAQLLEKQLNSDEQLEYTNLIIKEADRLQNLIRKILGPNTLPKHKPCNIHDALEHVKFLLSNEVNQNIQLNRDYDPSLPMINADPDQLIQAILNVVRNACQALQVQGGTVVLRTRPARNITIGKTIHKLVLRLDIIDDGPGIPEELQDRIFLPMVKGNQDTSSHLHSGSGLGLSIAQSLINQHEGYIVCDSQPGNTVFSIFLPLTGKAS